jgi:homoserine kinase
MFSFDTGFRYPFQEAKRDSIHEKTRKTLTPVAARIRMARNRSSVSSCVAE